MPDRGGRAFAGHSLKGATSARYHAGRFGVPFLCIGLFHLRMTVLLVVQVHTKEGLTIKLTEGFGEDEWKGIRV